MVLTITSLQVAVQKRQINYNELIAVEGQNLIPNAEEFECPICFSTISEKEGVVLRECLHKFCRYIFQQNKSMKLKRNGCP